MASTNLAIGIDLGTTYSCVAVFRNGKVEIIDNEQGKEITPSYVAFNKVERLVGDAAKAQLPLNPKNTIFDAKRLIGRKFDDINVQNDMKHWPFKVINANGKPKIEVEYKGQNKAFYPEEVSSMVLAKMKETAESYLGQKVTDAVITVPAYFNEAQRHATKNAGKIAGLNVRRIISEPTAAAIAYGLDRKSKSLAQRNVLIFDLGGGTFDVSILTINGGVIDVKATSGDTHLGGEDFDNRLVTYFEMEFKRKHGKDLSSSKRALARLKKACEQAKRCLTSAKCTDVVVDAILDGIDFFSSITRARFEELNGDLFRATLDPVIAAMNDAGMKINDIHDIVLVGGSTRIPKVQQLLQDFFNGRELNRTINPDEAVAYGAAVHAAKLAGYKSEKIEDIVVLDITPMSLGLQIYGGTMLRVVERNTKIPTRKTSNLVTSHDNLTSVAFGVFEGERVLCKDNNFLGKFWLNGLRPAPRGVVKFDVTFDIDADGLLEVTAVDTFTGNWNKINISNERDRLTSSDINRMVAEAELYIEEDEKHKQDAKAMISLEEYCFDAKNIVEGKKILRNQPKRAKMESANRASVVERCAAALEWIKTENPDAAKCKEKEAELRKMFDPVIHDS